jgi:L-lysine 2,3-aminomutase
MSTSQPGPAKLSAIQNRDWKVEIAESFRDIDSLLNFCEIRRSDVDVTSDSAFMFRVTRYFASLIEKGDPLDPLLLQVLPNAAEARVVPGYSRDAVGDQLCMPIPGLIHKYHGRVLLTLTGACAIHCRYCFRRHFPYAEASVDYKPGSPAMKYLAENTDCRPG